MRKNFKNGIVILIIFSLFSSSFLNLTKIAHAQQYNANGSYSGSGDYGVDSGGITGYIGSLAPAITQLPLCKGKLKSGLKNLFKQTSSLSGQVGNPITGGGSAGGATNILQDEGNGLMTDDSEVADGDSELTIGDNLNGDTYIADSEASSVATFDKIANSKLDVLTRDGKITKEKVSSLEENDTCLKSIARMVIKMLLQKITISTIAWIQSGREGKPAFLDNPGDFFGDLAKTEILQFGAEINDPVLFPFGREFIINKALSYNRKFQDNATYSLDKLIKDTSPEFSASQFNDDFGKGGWNAWVKMTAVDSNNALGFQVMAGKELESRIAKTNQQIREELQQAEGYLGDERCVEPQGVTKAEHRAAMSKPEKNYVTLIADEGGSIGSYNASASYGSLPGYYKDSKGIYEIVGACKRWEYVTPGQMIATAATKVVNYPDNNYLKAEDLNDAVAAIIDAFIASFSADLVEKGFANLSRDGADGSLIINTDEYGKNYIDSQVENDFYGSSMTNWLRKNNNFNIRYDLTQAFIDTQRTYADKLKEYNKELEKLIRNIYQLDYCIPGPAPDWKQRAYENLTDVSKSIPSQPNGTVAVIKGLFQMLKGISVGVSFFIKVDFNIGYISEGVLSMLGEGLPEEVMTRYFYTTILVNHTGLRVAPSNQIGSKGEVLGIISETIEGYDDAIKKTFNRNVMPDITGLAAAEYNKVKGYRQIIENNLNEIAIVNSVVSRLKALKEEMGALSQAQIEALGPDSPIVQKFARISANLVDGDSIADVVRLIGQTKDTIEYIFKDLLSGPNGCECQIANTPQGQKLELETDRMPYPKNLFIPLPGRNYQITGVQCQPNQNNNSYNNEVPYESNDCPVGPTQAPDPENPNPPTPPLPTGCQNPNDNSNPFDGNQNAIDIECPAGLVSLNDNIDDDGDGIADEGECVTPDQSINSSLSELEAILTQIIEAEDSEAALNAEADFSKSIDNIVRTFKAKNQCESNDVSSRASSKYQLFQLQELQYKLNNPGFLKRGYYGQLESYNPYQFVTRVPPPDAIPEQTVKLPYGSVNLSQQCPVLVFGPSAERGASKALRSALKTCRQEYNGNERTACNKQAWEDIQVMVDRSCQADVTIQTICKDLKSDATSPTDSIRRFEKVMELF